MGLGFSALTTASHVVLVLAVLLLFSEVALVRHLFAAQEPARSRSVFLAAALVMASFVVERLYYVAARLLAPKKIDLWSMHPAPEVLSAMVALSVFVAFVALARLTSPLMSRARSTVALHGSVLVVVWAGLAWVLW